jgi:rod shape-determining protein MreC
MSVSRDDFSIAFRSALLQRGASQKFSIFSLIIVALVVFFLDVYGFAAVKTARSFINDIVYRVTYLVSVPTKMFPGINQGITSHLNLKKENEQLRQVIERYKAQELNLEYISNENKNLKKVLDTEDVEGVENIILAKVLVDRNSPYLKSIIINKGSRVGIIKGMPVTQNKYLVGRIVETNYLSSRVLLLNDLNSRIPVTFDEKNTQAILTGGGTRKPTLSYLPEDYQFVEGITVFASGKEGIFNAGTPIGKTKVNGEVKLFVDPNQLSFVTVNLIKPSKEVF